MIETTETKFERVCRTTKWCKEACVALEQITRRQWFFNLRDNPPQIEVYSTDDQERFSTTDETIIKTPLELKIFIWNGVLKYLKYKIKRAKARR